MVDEPEHADKAPPKLARALGGCLGLALALSGIVFALLGLAISGAPLGSVNFSFGSVAAEGTVVKVEDVGDGHWSPVVVYDVDGKSHTVRGWAASQRRSRWTAGQKVQVLYMQNQHDLAQIDSFFDRWYYPSFIIVMGVSFIAGGVMFCTLGAGAKETEQESPVRTPADGEPSPKPAARAPWQGPLSVLAALLMIFAGTLCVGLGVVTCIEHDTWLAILPIGGFGLMLVLIGVATLRNCGVRERER